MKKVKSLLCLLLVLAMLCTAAACKKSPAPEEEDSASVEIEYVYETADGQKVDGNTADGTGADGTAAQNGTGGTSAKKKGTSGKKGSSAKPANAEKFRGTTVRFATWKDPNQNEDGVVVKAFEKEYGIKVKVDMVGQLGYVNTIAGYIAAGNSPDIYFCNNDFPACLSCLQPIDAAKIDTSDPIWDKGMLETSRINGKSYLLNTVGNIWNEVDCVFFNKRLLRENNITTPEEYYKAGKWNFETLTKVMRDVKAIGPDYIGGYLDWEVMIGLTGSSYYKWNNGKFSNGIDSRLTEVTRYLATSLKEGLIRGVNNYNLRDDFLQGKVGVAVTNAFGLKKTGYWSKMNPDDIGFTYLPDVDAKNKAVTTGLFRGWGIIKGAKNPEAAGIFLRYYLDVNNYDTSIAFLNSDAESFFFKLTSGVTSDKKNTVVTVGCKYVIGSSTDLGAIAMNDPTQVATALDSVKPQIDSDVKMLNDFVAKQTK